MTDVTQDGLADLVVNFEDTSGEVQDQDAPSDEVVFDIEVLISKLEAYQASVEEAQARIRRKRSINPREVSEMAAAARLQLRLDEYPPVSSASHGNSLVTSPTALAFPSSASSNGSSWTEGISYFDPPTPDDYEEEPVAVFAANTTRDTWKSSHSIMVQPRKETTHEVSTGPSVSSRSPSTRLQEDIMLLSSNSAIHAPLPSPAFPTADWLRMPPAIGSRAASESSEGRKSIDQMSMCPPNEDRIRREIEEYTIKDWIDTEDIKQLEVVASAKEPAQNSILPLDSGLDEENVKQSTRTAQDSCRPLAQYGYGRTTFRERMGNLWHRRRTKTDKIIALYFDMEPPKSGVLKTRTTTA